MVEVIDYKFTILINLFYTVSSRSKKFLKRDGTNIFLNSTNSSDAAGFVGGENLTITKAPYKVKSCDQVLQISMKFLDKKDYSKRTPGFMTLSIYFTNFFNSNSASELLESMHTQELTRIPMELGGAPGCTIFSTTKSQRDVCFESPEIFRQVSNAVQKFMACKPDPKKQFELESALANCNLGKVDLSKNGPFGKAGRKIKHVLDKIEKKKRKEQDKVWKGVAPYYRNKPVPGDDPNPTPVLKEKNKP